LKPSALPAACAPLSDEDYERLKAGRPRLWTNPKQTCITCLKQDGNTYRWYAEGSREDVVTYECNCRDQWLLHLWLLNAGIGLNYQRLTWEDIATIPADVVSQVMDYAVNAAQNIAQGRNVVLWSPGAGTGKTLLLILLMKELMKLGIRIHFSQFNSVIDLFTDSWRDKAEREQWNRRVRNVDVLSLDDIGKENKGRIDMVESMIDQVLRARVADALPTFITTNWTPQQLEQGYGSYVSSLLSEATFIEVTGLDFRRRRGERMAEEARQGLTRPITVV
jgi:DNA replication protein DnaC